MSTLLEFTGVGFDYGRAPVLDDIAFTIDAGSTTALIGPNGAGKTTLLRLAAGVLRAARGEVRLDGRPFHGSSGHSIPVREVAHSIALVPQQLEVAFEFTVEQVVEQGRTPYLGWLRGATREDRRAVERAMELTDVGGLRDRVFNQLSGGERQRVKIALGLAQEPRLLLLDEPTQNLDIGRQVELLDLLDRLHAEGITILASMHDLHLVPHNFDRVLLLTPGEALRTGTPAEMLRPALLERAFHCPPGRHPLLIETMQTPGGGTA